MKREILVFGIILLFIGLALSPSINADKYKVSFDDNTPPVTTIILIGIMGDNGWFVSDVTITFNVTDESGIIGTYYSFDNMFFKIYTAPIVVVDDGEHTIYYYSIDEFGNVENLSMTEIKIDQTEPEITGILYKYDLNEYIFEINLNDMTSGHDKVEFYIENQLMFTDYEKPYEWIIDFNFSLMSLSAIGYDTAGNCNLCHPEQPVGYHIFGLICNKKIIDKNVSFFAILVLESTNVKIFERITMPNDYTGYIGNFIIFAKWSYNITKLK